MRSKEEKEVGTVCNCFCSSITQEIKCYIKRGLWTSKEEKYSKRRCVPLNAAHRVRAAPLPSPFPLFLISSDIFHNANSLGTSMIIWLEAAAEIIELNLLSLIEPIITTTNNKSPAGCHVEVAALKLGWQFHIHRDRGSQGRGSYWA